MDVSTRIRGERSGFHVRSVQNFVRLGRAEGIPILQREFRRLRAATYFAHDGKVGKTPPGFAQDGSSAPIFAHPGPRLRGLPLEHRAALPARKVRSAWVRFRPAPRGACVCINFRVHASTTAPQFAEPTSPVRRRPRSGPLAEIPRRRSGTAPLKFSSHSGPGGPAKI